MKPRLSLSLKKANKARHSEDRELQVAKDITNTTDASLISPPVYSRIDLLRQYQKITLKRLLL